MSFDLMLMKIVDADSAKCSVEEAAACLQVLASANYSKPTKSDSFVDIKFSDGSHVQASIWESEEDIGHCSFNVRDSSPLIFDFIYKMADAGKTVIFNHQGSDTPENPYVLATSQSVLDKMGYITYDNPMLCRDVKHLMDLLGFSFGQWEKYRDQIIDSAPTTRLKH